MARSKKVRKALEIRKQLRQANKTVKCLEEKWSQLVISLSSNEVVEYQALENEAAVKEMNNGPENNSPN